MTEWLKHHATGPSVAIDCISCIQCSLILVSGISVSSVRQSVINSKRGVTWGGLTHDCSQNVGLRTKLRGGKWSDVRWVQRLKHAMTHSCSESRDHNICFKIWLYQQNVAVPTHFNYSHPPPLKCFGFNPDPDQGRFCLCLLQKFRFRRSGTLGCDKRKAFAMATYGSRKLGCSSPEKEETWR